MISREPWSRGVSVKRYDYEGPTSAKWRYSAALIHLSLLANVVVFHLKPLFDAQYVFPWDFRDVQLPMLTFLADQLREGQFALWNPFTYCGNPVFANIEACFFHPLILIAALISTNISPETLPILLEWVVVLQVWIAGVATYHLLRELETGPAAAWTGAIIFQTGGYFASRTEHIGAMMAVSWMPLAWLAVLKLSERFRPGWLAALSAALGMAVLGGFPQPTLAVFVSTAALSLVLVAVRMAGARVIPLTACGCLLGLALSAVQFIPTVQLARNSVAMYRAGWLGAGGGLYWQSLVSLVLPNYYGIFDMKTFRGPGEVTFLYLYSSIAGLLLAVYALVVRRSRRMAMLVIMTAFGLLWMLGEHTPLWRMIYPWLPEKVRIGIHPEYTYCIFTMGLAALAAKGLQALRVPERARVAIGIVIAADLFLVGSGRPMNLASRKLEPGVTSTAFGGSKYLLSEVRRRVEENVPPWRIDMVDAQLEWSMDAPITRVPTANGVSPLALENVIQLRLFLHDGFPWGWYYPVEKLDSPVLDLMNVKYLLVTPRNADRVRASPRFRHVASLPGNELFENLTVMPRFFLVRDLRPVSSLAEARGLVERGEIDFRRTAITNRTIELPAGTASGVANQVSAVDYQPAKLELSVQTGESALLVLAESYYPGWKAWLDETQVPIYEVDLAFRGVVVPRGMHHLRMEFQPMILPISIAISVATAVGLMALAWLGTRRGGMSSADVVTGVEGQRNAL